MRAACACTNPMSALPLGIPSNGYCVLVTDGRATGVVGRAAASDGGAVPDLSVTKFTAYARLIDAVGRHAE